MYIHHYLDVPAPDVILRKVHPEASFNLTVCDVGGMVDMCRNMGTKQEAAVYDARGRANALEKGSDKKAIDASDKYLAEMEGLVFAAKQFETKDDVTGSLPNIPAFLAGTPYNMRKRTRQTRPAGPLVIITESIHGAGTWDQHHKRGAATLALVRLLSNFRPVELYVTGSYGGNKRLKDSTETRMITGHFVACRVDTAPINLSQACYMIADQSFVYNASFVLSYRPRGETQVGSPHGWAWSNPSWERTYAGEAIAQLICPGSDFLYIPAAFGNDMFLENPTLWLKIMLAKYGGKTVRIGEDDEGESQESLSDAI